MALRLVVAIVVATVLMAKWTDLSGPIRLAGKNRLNGFRDKRVMTG